MKKEESKTVKNKSLARSSNDTGSSEVQIGFLSNKIERLSDHFKKFKKDKHSAVGLLKAVNKRKRLLTYLKKNNPETYSKVIKELNIRK